MRQDADRLLICKVEKFFQRGLGDTRNIDFFSRGSGIQPSGKRNIAAHHPVIMLSAIFGKIYVHQRNDVVGVFLKGTREPPLVPPKKNGSGGYSPPTRADKNGVIGYLGFNASVLLIHSTFSIARRLNSRRLMFSLFNPLRHTV